MKYRLIVISAIMVMAATLVSCEITVSTNPDISPSENDDVIHDDNGDKDDTPTTSPEADNTIEPWLGTWAEDKDNDIVGENEDFFYELNSFHHRVTVTYHGDSATVECANSDIRYHIDGAYVAIDMKTNGVSGVEIIASGTTKNGALKIYSDHKYKLLLNGVDITSQQGPAINSQSKKRIYLDLGEGTTNRLTDASIYSDDSFTLTGVFNEDRKGALFAEGNVILSGYGALVVSGRQRHAIATDGCYYQRPGTTVAILESYKNGIHANGDSDDGTGIYIGGGVVSATIGSAAGKGLKCDMDIVIDGGSIEITTTGNAYYDSEEGDTSSSAGIKADGNIRINGGYVYTTSSGSGGKGLNADGSIEVNDGIVEVSTSGGRYSYTSQLTSSPKGIKADGDIRINGGSVSITVTGRSEGSEGLESKSSITFNGGDTVINAYDDAINAASAITVNGGRIYACASNNDGIDSNGTMEIYGGLIIGIGGNAPEAGIDIDRSDMFRVYGGTAIGLGGSLQSTPSTASTQNSVAYGGVTLNEGSTLVLATDEGTLLWAFDAPRTISGATLFFTLPELTTSESYTIYGNSAISSYSDIWHGWYYDAIYEGGTSLTTFTPTSVVTTIGSVGGGPGGGGPGGGGGGRPR